MPFWQRSAKVNTTTSTITASTPPTITMDATTPTMERPSPLEHAEPSELELMPDLPVPSLVHSLASGDESSPELPPIVSPSLEDQTFNLNTPRLPDCWGHRGASASYPENTLMSFVEACKAGADGIETDIHMTADDELVMFHDPELHRTTDGTGRIHDLPWRGVLEHVRTLAQPAQPIPRFSQLLDLLLQPENMHVKVNIDCKVENDPVRLFTLIRSELVKRPGWEVTLAPRLILGLWHPKFLEPAMKLLPPVQRFCISMSLSQVRQYFWACSGFSVYYPLLLGAEGEKFRLECAAAGKRICTWTVNEREEMLQCVRWGVFSVISDRPELWRQVKADIAGDSTVAKPTFWNETVLPFLTYRNWWFDRRAKERFETEYLEREGGKFFLPSTPLLEATDEPVSVQPLRPSQLV